jgi:N-acetylmuramoyl-L-alanine amidase
MNIKLALDAGHGMGNRNPNSFDPGAVSAGFKESDIALQWCVSGEFLLEPKGIEVFLTRDDAMTNTPVSKRDDIAKSAGCNRFISIHCNAATGTATGVEAFYRDSADKAFAEIVLDCLVKATGLKNRGLKSEGASQHSRLAILDFGPPACLIEIGFIDNPKDRAVITSRETRVKFFELLGEKLK